MWLWRGSGKGSDVDGREWWDVVWDLDGVWSINSIESDSVEALRVGGTSGKTVLAPIGR